MKTISIYLKGLFSFWALALVIILMGVTLFLTATNHFPSSFTAVITRINVLNVLEGQLSSDLSSMQLHQARALFAYSYSLPPEEHLEKAKQASESVRNQLAELTNDGSFNEDAELYSSDVSSQLNDFIAALDTRQELFDKALTAIQEGNDEETFPALDELETQSVELNDALTTLIVSVEQDRLAALAAFPIEANVGILINSVGLVICLILALIGYRVIASTVQPLRHLRNIMTSIGGDQYRAANYSGLLKHGGPGGNLARLLDQLAQEEQAHNAGAKQEIERLRQELYESRRRRLKLYHDPEQSE